MFEVRTGSRVEIVDITSKVKEVVRESGIADGIALIYTKHTTTAIIVNEGESRLIEDILSMIKSIIPTGAGYMHDQIDNNADAHLRAILFGNSVVIPIDKGRLDLGTWQSILFIELDGPRTRKVIVKLI